MKKHYHYLVSYNFSMDNGDYGFGSMVVLFERNINHLDINSLTEYILEKGKEFNEKIKEIAILFISPVECGCENEENKISIEDDKVKVITQECFCLVCKKQTAVGALHSCGNV